MNHLKGKIERITTEGQLSLVNITVGNTKVTAIVIDTPDTATYLQLHKEINILFKATEVIIAKGNESKVSLQNQFEGTISAIEKGVLLSKIEVTTEVGLINSIITANAVNKLQLSLGDVVVAMVKTNEIMLSE